jgi:hypothetical protein
VAESLENQAETTLNFLERIYERIYETGKAGSGDTTDPGSLARRR